ncbi:hypothetical protein ACFWBG_07835 [Nocardia salmonicida]|uniref:hypothetical protein n=1 Tax=Nocardia salmonicida TaxID=53431 RepID=UPI0036714633
MQLQLHIALVDEGSPSFASRVLIDLLGDKPGRWDEPPLEAPLQELSRSELAIALLTFFPAPWTPAALARVLSEFRADGHRETSEGGWMWGSDPDFTATRRSQGGWEIERHQDGSANLDIILDTDDDLILLWMSDFRDRHAGFHQTLVRHGAADEFAGPARAVRAAQAADTAYPYLQNWRREREEFLDVDGA